MGSKASLRLGKMDIDWGKYNVFRDHSSLFQPSDVLTIPYYYFDESTEGSAIEMKEGYARTLSAIKPRMDLLGYNLSSLKNLYNAIISECERHSYKLHLPYEVFYNAVKSINVEKVDTIKLELSEGRGYDFEFGDYVRLCILEDLEIKKHISIKPGCDDDFAFLMQERYLNEFLENLDPYITLRILAENQENLDLTLTWNFADIIESGWFKREEIVRELAPLKKILIVTEGSSDTFILRRTIEELYPDISDFFDFVDMKENYPFTGTGNLYNFCMGLCRINVQNQIIVIFDNDTVGVEKYDQASFLEKPADLIITKLPDHNEFLRFMTKGPQGCTFENINGKAVSIESFLDLNSVPRDSQVIWTSYIKNKKKYQGELEDKDAYVRSFKKSNINDGSYDTSKLKYLINFLIELWTNRFLADDEPSFTCCQ